MCRLSELTQEQIDRLVNNRPIDKSTSFNKSERFIGFNIDGYWGTFCGRLNPTIISYIEMMQLLKGKDMDKQEAKEQMAVMQIEMDKLKAIINKPEAKTGRVMSGGDVKCGVHYWCVYGDSRMRTFTSDMVDIRRIDAGLAFLDEETAESHLEYLKLEQVLRRAQIADGGEGAYTLVLSNSGLIHKKTYLMNYHKIGFKSCTARDEFRTAHTDEQLTLLIRGV
jgi:hypothetical protein